MLTAKQEQFAQNIVEGMTQVEAYRSAYDTKNMSEETAYEKASVLAGQDKARARVAELRNNDFHREDNIGSETAGMAHRGNLQRRSECQRQAPSHRPDEQDAGSICAEA